MLLGSSRINLGARARIRMDQGKRITLAPSRISSVRTCFQFDDEDSDDDDDEDRERAAAWRQRAQHRPVVQILNRMYEMGPMNETEEFMEWLKNRWGYLPLLQLVLVRGEMNLRIFRKGAASGTWGTNAAIEEMYDTVLQRLTDCMRLEYVRHHLSARMSELHRVREQGQGGLRYIDIPLGIYFGGGNNLPYE